MFRNSVLPTAIALLVSLPTGALAFLQPKISSTTLTHSALAQSLQNNVDDNDLPSSSSSGSYSRRDIVRNAPSLLALVGGASLSLPQIATADEIKITGVNDGNLPDLPFEASRSYLQYRFALQVAADYYVFDLQKKVGDIDEWGDINQLFQVNNNKGQGQPSKIERDFTNPMRIVGLSMLPDEADAMRTAQFKFERSMAKITKAVKGVRRDLPVEVDKNLPVVATNGWDEGREALNEFFAVMNEVTGLNEMKLIPPAGPDQVKKYGRSPRRYNELTKKTKLCQNRGGPALSQAWGQLMVSGYMQSNMDSCGIPDPIEYFFQ